MKNALLFNALNDRFFFLLAICKCPLSSRFIGLHFS